MKKIAFLVLILMSVSITVKSQKYVIDKIIDSDSTSKDVLYFRAMEWFSTTYKSASDVIQMNDKDQGIIIGKGAMKTYVKILGTREYAGLVYYTIKLSFKDNKYRYEINNVYHDRAYSKLSGSGGDLNNETPACGNLNMPKKYWQTIKYYADEGLNNLIASLETAMQKQSKPTEW
jgi:hypothetical protein